MMDGNLLQRLFYPQNNGRFKKALITSLVSVTISLILKFSERSFSSGPSDPARGVARCSQFDSNVSLSTENLCVCSDEYQAPDGKLWSNFTSLDIYVNWSMIYSLTEYWIPCIYVCYNLIFDTGKFSSGCRLSNNRSVCFPSTVGSNHVIGM